MGAPRGFKNRLPPRAAPDRTLQKLAIRFGLVALGGAALVYFSRDWSRKNAAPLGTQAEPLAAANQDNSGTPAPGPKGLGGLLPGPKGFSGTPGDDASITALIGDLLNQGQALRARRQAARLLARAGSPEAMEALRKALAEGSSALKAAVAEALGENPSTEAKELLIQLAQDPDENTASGAIRGLSMRGGADSAKLLARLLLNGEKSGILRSEAALALGEIKDPSAFDALKRAIKETPDEGLREDIFAGLGKRPFTETKEFFTELLAAETTSNQDRVFVLESLGSTEGDPSGLLLQYAGADDKEVRAAAAWSLISADSAGSLAAEIAALAGKEQSPEVRGRLYHALSNQEGLDAGAVLGLVQKEADPQARSAALDLLATACGSSTDSEAARYFNQAAVPELRSAALQGDDSMKLASVMTLSRVRTSESRRALDEILAQTTDPRVAEAARKAIQRQTNPGRR